MMKFALAGLAAIALTVVGAAPSEAGAIWPRHYAYSQLVYGHAEQLYGLGCLRWGWHNRSWYDYCAAPQDIIAWRSTRRRMTVRY
jgi:hypothetical protein